MSKLKEHYVHLPESTLLHAKFKAMSVHSRLLYSYLIAKRAGYDGWFSYSYKQIRKDSGYRFEMIAKAIGQLSDAGFIEYEHGGLMLNHNRYYLEPSWLTRDS